MNRFEAFHMKKTQGFAHWHDKAVNTRMSWRGKWCRSREAGILVLPGLELVSHGGGHISIAWGHHAKTHTSYGELVEQNDKDRKSLEITSCERWLKNSISFGKENSWGEGDKCSHWLHLHQGLPWIWCIRFVLLLLKKSDHKPGGL